MAAKDMNAIVGAHIHHERLVLDQLVAAARSVVPVLKDHNLSNTAKELERLLFEYDALNQDMQNAVLADPAGFLDALNGKMRGRSPGAS